jgi:hypothetical protein
LWETEEYRGKQAAYKKSEDWIKQNRATLLKNSNDPKTRQAATYALREKWKLDEFRNQVTEKIRRAWEDNPELKKKVSERMRALWRDPEFRAKMANRKSGKRRSPTS